jgi:uncharacterized protein YjbI with pentapeptide repeats
MPAPPTSRCRFTTETDSRYFDPETESFLETTEGTWRCPHYVFGSTDRRYCPFHLGLDELPAEVGADDLAEACYHLIAGVDATRFRRLPDSLESYVEQTFEATEIVPAERTQFVGGRFGDVTLDYRQLDGYSNVPVDFRTATFDGRVSLRHGSVGHEVRFDGVTFDGPVAFVGTAFERRAMFSGATFAAADVHHATFESWAGFDDVVVDGEANFRGVDFEHGLFAVGISFESAADFMAARFDAVANFADATFGSGAVFSSTTFRGNATFRNAVFESPVVLSENFVDDTDVDERWDRISVVGRTVPNASVVFRNVTCRGKLDVRDATVDGDVHVTSSELSGGLVATDLDVRADRIRLDLSGTGTVSGRVGTDHDRVEYDLTDATVGELEIPDGAFSTVSFHGATFDGFDFGTYNRELSELGWSLHGAEANASARQLENLYLRAKNGAAAVGESRAASQFYRWEMRFRCVGHWNELRDTSSSTGRLVAAGRLLSNTALRATCGYGEAPTRPVVFSAALVFLFACVYFVIDAPLPYDSFVGYLTFSTEAFVSLVLGQPETVGLLLSSVVAVEGFVGGFMIALFVFTLTRSVDR